ncbi:MAG: PDZ domain-containing protein [Chitinophagales bacterium]
MKQVFRKIFVLAVAAALLAPVSLLAQNEEKDKENKESKDKKGAEQIIITRKGDKNEKITVEINGDKVTVNGKPLEDYKDGDLTVHLNKLKNMMAFGNGARNGNWNFNDNGSMSWSNGDENRAMLGVTTEKVEGGVEVQDVTKESAAEKAGLKEKDVITKIDDQKVEDPDGLSEAIGKHKPGEKVTVTYLRDKKEQKATAELTKWKGVNVFSTSPDFNYKMEMPDFKSMPRMQTMPKIAQGDLFGYMVNGRPRLGLSVQDTDDGKGVKVLDVDDEGSALKAGVKKDDVITEIDGKAVNSADEVAKIVRESKDKPSLMFKIQRSGKTQNIEVKIPRKLKTADL